MEHSMNNQELYQPCISRDVICKTCLNNEILHLPLTISSASSTTSLSKVVAR